MARGLTVSLFVATFAAFGPRSFVEVSNSIRGPLASLLQLLCVKLWARHASHQNKGESMNTGNYNTNREFNRDLNPEATADKLNELIRGERSAVETYQQAFAKVGNDPRVQDLRPLFADHEQAVRLLTDKVQACGAKPSVDSGAWGTWAETVMGTAKFFGDRAALGALKQGEEHGIKQYEDALQSETLDASARSIIQNQLLPQQRAHVVALDRIISTLN
jgi:uncharacterized protein (TIGR02284 family)